MRDHAVERGLNVIGRVDAERGDFRSIASPSATRGLRGARRFLYATGSDVEARISGCEPSYSKRAAPCIAVEAVREGHTGEGGVLAGRR